MLCRRVFLFMIDKIGVHYPCCRFNLRLSFKTTLRNSLIVFQEMTSNDYFALELLEGKLRCQYKFGSCKQVSVFRHSFILRRHLAEQ